MKHPKPKGKKYKNGRDQVDGESLFVIEWRILNCITLPIVLCFDKCSWSFVRESECRASPSGI